MAWKEQVSQSDFGPVRLNNGGRPSGASNLFDEMPESYWRSPSRVLEVTIHRAHYPVTEEVLHLVFDPFGVVEDVHVLGGSHCVLAQVVFETKLEATEAYGELHGRNIYDGCCQLDIHYGVSSKFEVPLVTSDGDTIVSSSSVLLCSSVAAMSTLDSDISSEMLPMEFAATETTATSIAAPHDRDDIAVQPVTVLDSIGCGIAEELQVLVASTQVQALLESTITEEVIIDTSVTAVVAALAIDMAANIVIIGSPSMSSTECLGTDVLVHSNLGDQVFEEKMLSGSNNLFNSSIGLEMLVNHSCKYMLSGCNINSYMLLTGCVPLDMHGESRVIVWELVEQQPWPPPTGDEPASGDADPRPLPWPLFHFAKGFNVGWYFSLCRKLWPSPAHVEFARALTVIVESQEYKFSHLVFGGKWISKLDQEFGQLAIRPVTVITTECDLYLNKITTLLGGLLDHKLLSKRVEQQSSNEVAWHNPCLITQGKVSKLKLPEIILITMLQLHWNPGAMHGNQLPVQNAMIPWIGGWLIQELGQQNMQDYNYDLTWGFAGTSQLSFLLLLQQKPLHGFSSRTRGANIDQPEIISFLDHSSENKCLYYLYVLLTTYGHLNMSVRKECNDLKGDMVLGDITTKEVFFASSLMMASTELAQLYVAEHFQMEGRTFDTTTETLIWSSQLCGAPAVEFRGLFLVPFLQKSRYLCSFPSEVNEPPIFSDCRIAKNLQLPWDPDGPISLMKGPLQFLMLALSVGSKVSASYGSSLEIDLVLNYSRAIQLVGYEKYLVWMIDLLMPWDPGIVVFNLKILLHRLGGKPSLKEGGNVRDHHWWAGTVVWAINYQSSCSPIKPKATAYIIYRKARQQKGHRRIMQKNNSFLHSSSPFSFVSSAAADLLPQIIPSNYLL